jgi:hypothetical protein
MITEETEQGQSDAQLFIYLDWNVVSDMLYHEGKSETEKVMFAQLASILLNHPQIVIPYSNAHLSDIMKSYRQGERERVQEKLHALSDFTKDLCISLYWGKQEPEFHRRDPFEFFNSMIDDNGVTFPTLEGLKGQIEEIEVEYGATIRAELEKKGIVMPLSLSDAVFGIYEHMPHNMDFVQLDALSPQFGAIFKKARVRNSIHAVVEDLFDLMHSLNHSPDGYVQLRNFFRDALKINPAISTFDNVINQLNQYLPTTAFGKSFDQLYAENNKSNKHGSELYHRITGKYTQLDFVGFRPEKMGPKNQYSNFFNDALHCYYATHCDVFITRDDRTYHKSRAVYQAENIGTQVMKPDEFLKRLPKDQSD